MAIIIKPRYTTTAAYVPTTSNIADAEFCINTTDRVIYQRVSSTVIPVASFAAKPRIVTVASSATVTPNVDTTDLQTITAQAVNLTLGAPTGTPNNGQPLMIRIKDNGTARTITWNAIYRAIGVTLPATTVISKTLYIGMRYNSADTKYDVLAVGQEA